MEQHRTQAAPGLLILLVGLWACLHDWTMAGLVVENRSGTPVTVEVLYADNQTRRWPLNDQEDRIVVNMRIDRPIQNAQEFPTNVREIHISYAQSNTQTLTRDDIIKKTQWNRKHQTWILHLGPLQ